PQPAQTAALPRTSASATWRRTKFLMFTLKMGPKIVPQNSTVILIWIKAGFLGRRYRRGMTNSKAAIAASYGCDASKVLDGLVLKRDRGRTMRTLCRRSIFQIALGYS